jgi:hypothetical protein
MASFVETTYCNPLIEEVWADPAVAGPDEDGWYWCYATDDEHEPLPVRRFKVARSRDLVHWQTHPLGAEQGALSRPIPNAGRFRACWAPDVRRRGPRDWLFYGSLKFDDHAEDGEAGHGIFAAPGHGPTGFAEPVLLGRGAGFTTIDPCFHHDARLGRSFLYWGSGHAAILGQELRPDGLGFAAGSAPRPVLSPDLDKPEERLWEGVHVIEGPAPGQRILLASGACTWSGPYRVRAFLGGAHPLEPFAPLAEDAWLLRENAEWNRCGQAFVQRDAIGQSWLFFPRRARRGGDPRHRGGGRDRRAARRAAAPALHERLHFDANGLPFVESGSPSVGPRAGPVTRRAQ